MFCAYLPVSKEENTDRRNETTSYMMGDGGLTLVMMSSMTGRVDLEGKAPMA